MRAVLEQRDEAKRRAGRARRDCEERYSWARVSADLARAVEATHALGAGRKATPAVPARRPLAWLLGIVDDAPCRDALRRLARTLEGSATPAVALFTRYARAGDVMLARELGFLIYRWDATAANARRIASSLLGPGWIGFLHPGERLEGDVAALDAFLAGLPDDVAAVALDGDDARDEPRVMRAGRVAEPRRTVAGTGLANRRQRPHEGRARPPRDCASTSTATRAPSTRCGATSRGSRAAGRPRRCA